MEEENKKVEEVKEEIATEEVKEEPVGDSENITSEPVKEEVKEEPVRKKSKLPIIILVVLLVVVLVGGIFIGKSLNSKDDKSDTKTEEKDKKKDNKEEDKEEDEDPEDEEDKEDKEKDTKDGSVTPAYNEDSPKECKGLSYSFKYFKYDKDTNTFIANLNSLDEMNKAFNEYFDSDGAGTSCLNLYITTEVKFKDVTQVLEYKKDEGSASGDFSMHNKHLFSVDIAQPLPKFRLDGNNLYITYYGCDVADGCPTYYVLDSKVNLKEDTESNFSKDNIKILEMYVTNSERFSVPSSVERVGYFDSNVKPEGLCYDNRKDAKPIGDCEEKYTFNINNKNVVIKMIIKDSVESFYVNDIKLNYNNKDGWVRTGSFYFVQIDSKVYVVAMVNMEYTYVIDLSENKIVNTVGAKSNMLFSKLDGKPIMIVNDVDSSLSLDFDDDRANAVYYYIGSNEKHKLTSELNEGQYVDLLLTSAAW